MTIRIEPFTAEHLPAVRHFCAAAWPDRPTHDAFMRWRYLEVPDFEGLVAMRDAECVGTLFAFRRPYLWDDQEVTVLEGHDWWVLPTARGHRVGIRLLQRLMERPHPQVAWGGSEHTQGIMPKLGWSALGHTQELVLPLGGRRIATRLTGTQRFSGPVGDLVRGVTQQLVRFAPAGAPRRGEVRPLRSLDDDLLGRIRETQTFGPLTPARFLRWLQAGPPDQGVLLPLGFTLGGAWVGWALARVVHTEQGTEGILLDAWADDPSLYAWVVKSTVLAMLPWHPDRVAVRAGEGPLRDALLSVGFRLRGRPRIYSWHPDLPLPVRPPRPTRLCTDLPLGPYGR